MIIGIICIALASIAFGIGPVFSKELIISGLSTLDIMLYPKISTLFVIGAILLVRRISLKVSKSQLWQLVLLCGCSNGLTGLLLVGSYHFLPIGLATMFHFIYPAIVTVVMTVFYKEKMSALRITAIVLAISGIYLILDLSGNMSLAGVALAIGSGFSYAVYVIANRKSAYKDLPVWVLLFYSSLINFTGILLFQLVTGRLIIPTTSWDWIIISANGLITNLFAFLMIIIGIRRIGATNAAIANMLEPITALVAGIVIYDEKIDFRAFCGCILVFLAITFIAMKNDNTSKSESK